MASTTIKSDERLREALAHLRQARKDGLDPHQIAFSREFVKFGLAVPDLLRMIELVEDRDLFERVLVAEAEQKDAEIRRDHSGPLGLEAEVADAEKIAAADPNCE